MPPGKPPRQSTRDLRRAWTDKRAGKWIRRRSLRSFVTDRQAYHFSSFAAPRFMRSFIADSGQRATIRARILGLPRKMSRLHTNFQPLYLPRLPMRGVYGIFSALRW